MKTPVVLVALLLSAACGREAPTAAAPLAPPSTRTGACALTRTVTTLEHGVPVQVTMTVYYSICPPDSVLAGTGWTRVQ